MNESTVYLIVERSIKYGASFWVPFFSYTKEILDVFVPFMNYDVLMTRVFVSVFVFEYWYFSFWVLYFYYTRLLDHIISIFISAHDWYPSNKEYYNDLVCEGEKNECEKPNRSSPLIKIHNFVTTRHKGNSNIHLWFPTTFSWSPFLLHLIHSYNNSRKSDQCKSMQ